jgi:hypothetical protein
VQEFPAVIATIIRDSPVLAGSIAILIAIFIFLVIAIASAHRRPREEPRSTQRRYEPDFDGDGLDLEEFDRDYGPRRVGGGRPEGRRGRYGFGAIAFSFLLGVAVGLGGLAAMPHVEVASLLTALRGLVEAGPSTAREQALVEPGTTGRTAASAPAAGEAEPPVPKTSPKRQRMREAVAPQDHTERDQRLAKFVERLKSELPKPVGPTTVLASVERMEETVTLGYSLSIVPTEAEVTQIQEALKSVVVDSFCTGKSEEAKFLNDNGIVFRMIYTDKEGRTVARLTAEPRFCSGAG